jgi:LPP20 lipoprotein
METQSILRFNKLILVFLLISNFCFAQKGEKPDWLQSRPISSLFYSGIGSASTSEKDYKNKAKQNALADLVSEISVNISGASLLKKFEDDKGVLEEYQSAVQVSFMNEIEGYELAGAYEDGEHYWVYYRLLRQTYQEMVQKKLDNARDVSFGFYQKCLEAKSKNQVNNAIDFGIKAIVALQDYLNENIQVNIDGEMKNLSAEIYGTLMDVFSKTKLRSKSQEMVLSAFSEKPDCIQFSSVYVDGMDFSAVSEIPVTASFEDGEVFEKLNTGQRGHGKLCLSYQPKFKNEAKIKVQINLQYYTKDKFILSLLSGAVLSSFDVYLKTNNITAYLEIESTEYGVKNKKSTLAAYFRSELAKSFNITNDKNKADVIIGIETKMYPGGKIQGEMYDMDEVFLDANITVLNVKNNQEVFNESLSGIKLLVNEKDSRQSRIQAMGNYAIQKVRKKIKPVLLDIKL